jgi:hypothetical protein
LMASCSGNDFSLGNNSSPVQLLDIEVCSLEQSIYFWRYAHHKVKVEGCSFENRFLC